MKKLNFNYSYLLVLLIIIPLNIYSETTPKKTNVILIFMDDMGYGDIGPFGSKYTTPHLDNMAQGGRKFTSFYASSSACTPSRAALLTGTYADRIGMDGNVVFPGDKRGLNPKEFTIAEMFKSKGYTTGCFGKWHLGDAPEFMPLAQGFDIYEGIPYSNDMWIKGNKKRNYPPLPWMKQDKAVAHIPDNLSQAELIDAITDATVQFIKNNKDKPFFAYVPHAATHVPYITHQKRLEAAGGDVYKALITEVDNSVGRVLDTVRQLGLSENTLVIFTNDNGGFGKALKGNIRGHKFGQKYEGHMRVATLAWWPGKVEANSICDEIATTTDLLPTLADIIGSKLPSETKIDGKIVTDLLLGKKGVKSPHKYLFYEGGAVRYDQWKLVQYSQRQKLIQELYNLNDDPGEQSNLATSNPEKVMELSKVLKDHVDQIKANSRSAGFVEKPTSILTHEEAKNLPTLYELRNKK